MVSPKMGETPDREMSGGVDPVLCTGALWVGLSAQGGQTQLPTLSRENMDIREGSRSPEQVSGPTSCSGWGFCGFWDNRGGAEFGVDVATDKQKEAKQRRVWS